MKSIYLLISLLFFTGLVWANNFKLSASLPVQTLKNAVEVGSLEVIGVGKVLFKAKRNGGQIVIKAQGPDGKAIGRAETIVGLRSTPIYILTPSGLEKIEIVWTTSE